MRRDTPSLWPWEEATETLLAELRLGRHWTEKEMPCSEENLTDLIYLEMDKERPRSSEQRESCFTVLSLRQDV